MSNERLMVMKISQDTVLVWGLVDPLLQVGAAEVESTQYIMLSLILQRRYTTVVIGSNGAWSWLIWRVAWR
jgi:hypothetical protein